MGDCVSSEVRHDEEDSHKSMRSQLRRSMTMSTDWQKAVKRGEVVHALFDEHQKLLEQAGAKYVDLGGKGFKKGDCLLVVDMQNDFVPHEDAPEGGRFGVAEGSSAASVICNLMQDATKCGALIVATRDYHPKNHCSFMDQKGPFPPHCIQGSPGSFFFPIISQALEDARKQNADVRVVFKGFAPEVDSFGGFKYTSQYFGGRALGNECGAKTGDTKLHGCCALDWTGSFCLECSNLPDDINAPPDVLAVFGRESLQETLTRAGVNRLFVCGLAMDFCVLDSALNAAAAGMCSQGGIYLIDDAARAAHIPGIGSFGSGFLSSPDEIVKKLSGAGVKLVKSSTMGLRA